jgi:hypothetical protein
MWNKVHRAEPPLHTALTTDEKHFPEATQFKSSSSLQILKRRDVEACEACTLIPAK